MFLYECSVYGFINVQGCVELLCRPVALLHLAYKEGIMIDCISLSPSKCSKTLFVSHISGCVNAFSLRNFHAANLFSVMDAQAVHKIKTCLYKKKIYIYIY